MRLAALVALAALIVGGGVLLSRKSASGTSAAAPSIATISPDAVLEVDELMRNVDRYTGDVRVQGVVSAVAPRSQSLALIDTREVHACGTTGCAELVLPVHWQGPMPKVGQSIQVSGSVEESNGKLVFAARRVEAAATQPGEPR